MRDTQSEELHYRQLALVLGSVFIDLESQYISAATRRRLSAELVRSKRWVPFVVNDRRIVVIVDDPFVAVAGGTSESFRCFGPPFDRERHFALASPSAVQSFIDRHYPTPGEDG